MSVLAGYDSRLRAVGIALEHRLHGSESGEPVVDVEPGPDEAVTGKGLDAIIDEVKKRTGASQFLRGKHSSLDPFGAGLSEGIAGVPNHLDASQPPIIYDPSLLPPPGAYHPAYHPHPSGSHTTSPSTSAHVTPSQSPPPGGDPAVAIYDHALAQKHEQHEHPGFVTAVALPPPPHLPKARRTDSGSSGSRLEYFPVSDSRSDSLAGENQSAGARAATGKSKRKFSGANGSAPGQKAGGEPPEKRTRASAAAAVAAAAAAAATALATA